MKNTARVTASRLVAAGKFLAYKVLEWVDANGVERQWETVERPGAAGAVLIMARLVPSNRMILIRQFRPPANAMVIEFPAGLTDPGEDPATAAARELREETGYIPSSLEVHPAAFTSPGLANEAVHMVVAEIDENAPENLHPLTDFDPCEMIETILVDITDLPAFYRRETAGGALFDAKLAGYILALDDVRGPKG